MVQGLRYQCAVEAHFVGLSRQGADVASISGLLTELKGVLTKWGKRDDNAELAEVRVRFFFEEGKKGWQGIKP